jgi:hypothetical protein
MNRKDHSDDFEMDGYEEIDSRMQNAVFRFCNGGMSQSARLRRQQRWVAKRPGEGAE